MAVINFTTGAICYGRTTIAVDGSVPAPLVSVEGGNPQWLTDIDVIYQNVTAGSILQSIDINTDALTTEDAQGQNGLGAGNGVWAAYLAGVRTNVGGFGPFPNAGLGDVSETGQTLLIANNATFSVLELYSAAGALTTTINTTLTNPTLHIRENLISYQDASGWHLYDVAAGAALKDFVARANISNLIPFKLNGIPFVFEYETTQAQLSVREASSPTGLIVVTDGLYYDIDIRPLDATHCRMAWTTGAAGLADELVVLDIDVTDGTTQRGTVVAGAIVYTTGPTLEGTTFDTTRAGKVYLPLKDKVIDGNGKMTQVWAGALRKLRDGAQSVQTQVNNTPTPSPPQPGFGQVAVTGQTTVAAFQPNDVLTLTSADGSVAITTNPATKAVDLAVLEAASQWIPLVDGSEPPVLVSDGAGHLVLVAYP